MLCLNQLAAARRSHQKTAGGGAHFLISLPPHWLTRWDGCFFSHTCSLSRSPFIQQTVLFSLQFPGCFFHLFSNFPIPVFMFPFGFFFALILSSETSFICWSRDSSSSPSLPSLSPSSSRFFFSFYLFSQWALRSARAVTYSKIWMKYEERTRPT